jgi:hypothetical protein
MQEHALNPALTAKRLVGIVPRALQLVEVRAGSSDEDKDGSIALAIVPSTLRVLREMGDNLVMLCIFGAAREGKSTLMNMIAMFFGMIPAPAPAPQTVDDGLVDGWFEVRGVLCSSNCFVFSDTIVVLLQVGHHPEQRQTSGVWIWSVPLALPDGHRIVLMDVEGIGLGRDSVTSVLSALGVAVSSLSVLFVRTVVTDETWSDLASVVDMSRSGGVFRFCRLSPACTTCVS